MSAIAAVALATVLLLVIIGYLVWLILREQDHSAEVMDQLAAAIVRAETLAAENAQLANGYVALQRIITKIAESRDPAAVTDAMLKRYTGERRVA